MTTSVATSSANPSDPRDVLSTHVDLVRQIVRLVGRRQRLSPMAIEELESAVWIHLFDEDCKVVRQFRGQAAFSTFLTVVVTRLALDARSAEWGRWRPSTQARHLGPAALLFETLVFRDGYSPDEAAAELESRGYGRPSDEIRRLAERRRSMPRRYVPLEFIEERLLGSGGDPEAQLSAREHHLRSRFARKTIRTAVEALPREDRLLLRMRHEEGLKVSTMAQVLGQDQKALYRRLDALYRRLRRDAERAGVVRDDATGAMRGMDWTPPPAAVCA